MIQQHRLQDILNQWESDTLSADGYYHRQELKQASKGFCRTVDLLEPWLDKDHRESQRVMRLFVLSCHNAAHVLAKQGKHKEAEYYYSHAHFRLLSLLGQGSRSVSSKAQGSKRATFLDAVLMELRCTFKQLRSYLVRKNKAELAAGVKDESVRVVRQQYFDYVEDIFRA